MIVISTKNSKRLVKGGKYEVLSLFNNGSNNRYVEGTVYIKNLGRFSVETFTDTLGNVLPKINISPTQVTPLKFDDLKKGDIIVCISDNYKTLMKEGFYRIEELEKIIKSVGYFGYQKKECFIKLEGISRKLLFSSWNFRKLNTDELREINLNQLLNNQSINLIKTKNIKKIDLIPNKNEFLLKSIAKSICDPKRNNLSIIDWSCQKVDDKMGLTSQDFELIMSMTLKEILNLLDKH
jgi:hypothetical protein